MELILQQGLPHQQKAIDAICDALDGVVITPPVQFYENPQIDLADRKLFANLRALQNAVPAEYRTSAPVGACLNLDIKMETGTGKLMCTLKPYLSCTSVTASTSSSLLCPHWPLKPVLHNLCRMNIPAGILPMVVVMVQKLNLKCWRHPKTRKKGAVIFQVSSVTSLKVAARTQRRFMCFW